MLQTNASAWRVSQEFKTEFSLIGTGILKVCKCSEMSKNSGMDWGGSVSVWTYVYVSVNMYGYMTVCEFPYF